MKFWPLYQPARRHLHGFEGDYEVLRELVADQDADFSTTFS
jgi:hypothetical protein